MDEYKANETIGDDDDDDLFIEFENLVIEPKYSRRETGNSVEESLNKAASEEMKKRSLEAAEKSPTKKEALELDESIFDFSIENDFEPEDNQEMKPEEGAQAELEPAAEIELEPEEDADEDKEILPVEAASEIGEAGLNLGRYIGHPLEGSDPEKKFRRFSNTFKTSEDDSENFTDERASETGSVPSDDYDYERDDDGIFSYWQLEEDRRNSEEAARDAERRKSGKGGKGFRIGLLIYVIILVLIFAGADLILWKYMAAYEKTNPEIVVEQVTEKLKSGDISGLNIATIDGVRLSEIQDDAFTGEDEVADYIKDKLSADVTYTEILSESSEEGLVYMIQAEGLDFIKIELQKTGTEKMFRILPLPVWEETAATVMNSDYTSQSVIIQVPAGSEVYIDGILLDESYITGASVVTDLLDLQSAGIINELPTYDIYFASGYFDTDTMKVVGPNGIILDYEYDADQEMYVSEYDASDDFISGQLDRLKNIVRLWAFYHSGDYTFYSIMEYLLAGSPAYDKLEAAAYEIAYNYDESALTYDDDLVIDNFRKYSDECFSCCVSFTETIWSWDEAIDEMPWDMTWYFIKSGDNYYLADYKTN